MSVFVQNARKQFLEFATIWIDFVVDNFPECAESKDVQIFIKGVVANSTLKIDEQIAFWLDSLQQPLNPKRTKYAKAVERITQKPCTVFHAIAYRDIATLKHSMTSDMITRLDLFSKYESSTIDDDARTTGWKLLDKINAACLEFHEESPPQVPSRTEIQENIRMRNTKSEDTPSMGKAFHTHFNALCASIGSKSAIPDNASDSEIKQYMGKWNSFSHDSTDGENNSALCQRSDPRVLASLTTWFPDIIVPSEKHTNGTLWKNITQLNGFATVTENIPSDMMGRIESMANKLADDIVSGKTDMGSVNLQDIGEQVLSGCNEEDMSQFANNIDKLMPALQQFQSKM